MRIVLALLLAPLPLAASAEDAWPPEVAAIVDEAKAVCDGDFSATDAVTSRDLNGDGKPDWIIDGAALSCADSSGTYCGSGGCSVDTVIDGTRGSLLLHAWDTVTEGGTTYLTAPNDAGETVRFLWTGTDWQLQ
jgi:hypothetical protein